MQNKKKLEIRQYNQNRSPKTDLSLIVYTTANKIGGKLPTRPMIVLLDSGSSHAMMKQTSLPHGAISAIGKPKQTTTTNGVFSTTTSVDIQQLKFPKFGNQCIKQVKADVFHSPTCQYNIIAGRDILDLMGVKIDFKLHVILWMGRDIPMKSASNTATSSPIEQLHNHFLQEES